MSDIEFFSKLNPKRLTSLEEDLKAWWAQFLEDEKRNTLKRTGLHKQEPLEITRERFPEVDL